ncbi:ArsR/SmtB family transcription factor [Desulfogranum japonicum]|uniref:ArsR/SmtB family transcription factor n=1 Tax=Desulfogranum japonicum TaxID=231447 RepID=UPI000425C1B9|nr:metalloregulator ArsR/SmtB family transcription factor [Desulfogranum japonicum]
MRDFVKVMKALADPNRVRILKLLQEKELCVCEMKELFSLSQPTISKHLRVLEEANLVTFRKQGSWAIYRLGHEQSSGHAQAMLAYLEQTELDDKAFKDMLQHLPQVDRERIAAA